MSNEAKLKGIIINLDKAIRSLEDAADVCLANKKNYLESKPENLTTDFNHTKIIQERDNSERRAKRLEEANKEASRRLIAAMETIQAVLDK